MSDYMKSMLLRQCVSDVIFTSSGAKRSVASRGKGMKWFMMCSRTTLPSMKTCSPYNGLLPVFARRTSNQIPMTPCYCPPTTRKPHQKYTAFCKLFLMLFNLLFKMEARRRRTSRVHVPYPIMIRQEKPVVCFGQSLTEIEDM